jgi:SAM-dependent methyltransferase
MSQPEALRGMALGSISLMKRLLRPLFVRLARSLGIFELQQHASDVAEEIVHLREGVEAMSSLAERRATELREMLFLHSEETRSSVLKQFDERTLEISTKSDADLNAMRRSIDLIRSSAGASSGTSVSSVTPQPVVLQNEQVIEDSLYVALEDHFRGSESVIKERQASYLPHITSVVSADAPLLDIGCGRGEWLSVLKDNNISASGVDSNVSCVEDCKSKGLSVVQADLLDALRKTPEHSLGAITMFQVMEHLPFPVLVETFRLILRALKPGGVLIAEVPNAKNLRVSAGTFWIDPTHQRPLFPEFLQFLAKELGFAKADGLYVNNLSPQHDLSSLEEPLRNALQSVLDAVDTFGDFALIATA